MNRSVWFALARLSSATAFVNAVLRRAIREAELRSGADVSDPIEKIALQTSHPRMVDRALGQVVWC